MPLNAACTPHQFTLFRISLGSYLLWHFACLVQAAPLLFTDSGTLPRDLNPLEGLFPNVLTALHHPVALYSFLVVSALLAVGLLIGWRRRICAILLWYIWACLFNRNPFISNPSIPFIGMLLLVTACIQTGEPFSFGGQRKPSWQLPNDFFQMVWIVMALSYTASGLHKLGSPSWVDGSALSHLLANPLARHYWLSELISQTPAALLRLATYGALALEILFAPLALFRKTRPIVWALMVCMHLGILSVVRFSDLTAAMLVVHLFTFDRRWLSSPAQTNSPILFFDGVCGICNAAIDFLVNEDLNRALRFAPLQGKAASERLESQSIEAMQSMVLIDDQGKHLRSTAALRTLIHLGGLWQLLAYAALLVPTPIRDRAYAKIAANRYRWFGKRDVCRIPSPAEAAQFLD